MTKTCNGPLCNGVERLTSDFNKNKAAKDGLQTSCRECKRHTTKLWREANADKARDYSKSWRAENPEKTKAHRVKWQQENPEKVSEASRNWKAENKDRVATYNAEWNLANPGRANELSRQWKKNNPERVRENNANRRALEKERTRIKPVRGWWNTLLDFYGAKCMNPSCGSTEDLSLDHVVALNNGGWHEFENWQILCRSCNSSKRDIHNTDYRDSKRGVLVSMSGNWN